MTPAEIRNATLSQLRSARTAMLSAEWTLSLEGKDSKTQAKAARQFMRVHHAVQKLGNAELAAIKDALLQNESALAQGREKLAKALENLNRTKSVLQAAGKLLDIVSRVAALIL